MVKTATKGKKKAKTKANDTYGIDAVVDAVYTELTGNTEYPASARELTKRAIKSVIQLEQAIREQAVADGHRVSYIGHGTYEARERAARKGRNPQSGEEIIIPATTVPVFAPGKGFKDLVKGQ